VKRLRFVTLLIVFCAAAAASVPLQALDTAQQPAAPIPAVTTSLKLTVLISRMSGDKKVSSLPFVLTVVPGYDRDHSGDSMMLQMGSEVPLFQTVTTDNSNSAKSVTSWQYRSVGTSISISSRGANDVGQYNLNLNVTDSQAMSDPVDSPGSATGRPARFQTFTSNTRVLLRDGQTIQYTAATDKTSGEVVKLDVTLNVIK
jgi:hypothetical protein